MKSSQPSRIGVPLTARMRSSAKRLARRAHRISKDISVRRSSVDYHRSRINYHEGLITKLQEELLLTTELIAQKMEGPGSTEPAPTEQVINLATSSQENGSLHLPTDLLDSASSGTTTPECTHSPDIRCYETPWDMPHPLSGQTFVLSGYMDTQELANLDMPMDDYLELLLKSPGPSGGPGIC